MISLEIDYITAQLPQLSMYPFTFNFHIVKEICISYCRNLYFIHQLDYYNSKVESAAVL